MDFHYVHSRLDLHEEQIQRLQSDVIEIKSTLKILEADRVENAEFRKLMMEWMKDQGWQPVSGLESTFGSRRAESEDFLYSGGDSGCDVHLKPHSEGDLSVVSSMSINYQKGDLLDVDDPVLESTIMLSEDEKSAADYQGTIRLVTMNPKQSIGLLCEGAYKSLTHVIINGDVWFEELPVLDLPPGKPPDQLEANGDRCWFEELPVRDLPPEKPPDHLEASLEDKTFLKEGVVIGNNIVVF